MKTSIFHIILLSLLTVVSVIFFHSRFLINWDAGQFALGTIHFSLENHTPHPPGYFLFVKIGELLTAFTNDVNTSFILLSALAFLGGLIAFYFALFTVTHNASLALWGALLYFTNPVLWYERSVALTYSFEACAASLTLLCSLKVLNEKKYHYFILNMVGIALLAGFRPSIVLGSAILLVAQIIILIKADRRICISGITWGTLATLAWCIPFFHANGGVSETLREIFTQAKTIHATPLFDQASPILFLESTLFALNALLFLPLLFWKDLRCHFKTLSSRLIFLTIGFMTLFYCGMHFGEVGYIASIIPFALFLLLLPLSSHIHSLKGRVLIALLVVCQIAIFCAPSALFQNRKISETTARAMLNHDSRISTYLSEIKKLNPKESVIAVLRGQYFDSRYAVRLYPSEDIRLLSYYLPEYTLLDLLGVPGFYRSARVYLTENHSSRDIPLPPNAHTLLILADYLHPTVYPKGASLQDPPRSQSSTNIYRGTLDGVRSFEFQGFNFSR